MRSAVVLLGIALATAACAGNPERKPAEPVTRQAPAPQPDAGAHDASRASTPAPPPVAPSPEPPAQSAPPQDISLAVKARFVAEKPDDGAPTLHKTFVFTNRSDTDAYLSLYGIPFWERIKAMSPAKLFRAQPMQRRYGRMAPPTKASVLRVPAKGTAEIKRWDWSGYFFIDHPTDPARGFSYNQQKAGRVTITYCYANPGGSALLAKFIPSGASIWSGKTICAKPVRVNLRALPTDR